MSVLTTSEMKKEKRTTHHRACNFAEQLPIGIGEQHPMWFSATQHTRCCYTPDFVGVTTPENLLEEK